MPAALLVVGMASAVSSGAVFRFGLFEADVARNSLTRKGVRVKIQEQPFRVLILLLERPGEVVTREDLRKRLWPEGTYVDFDGSLNVILKKLRTAIDDESDNPRFIETVPRRGYRFIAPVSVEARSAQLAMPVAERIPAPTAGETARAVTMPNPRLRLSKYAVPAVVLVAAVAFAWLWLHRRQSVGLPFRADAQVPLRRSVAVLGFYNISGRADDAWLGTAFSEMLSTELAGGEKLRLISGEQVANLRASSPWPETDTLDRATTGRIGAALNSDLLILGSYTTIGKPDHEQVRIDVRLQDAKTGEILSEAAENGGRDEVFQLVAGVGAKLRSRLGVPQLTEPDQSTAMASMPSNREAARLYSLGLVKLREFDSLAARDLLQQACNADPKFALSHAMLARAWGQLGYEQKRKAETKKALDLSADLSRVDRMQVEGDYYSSLSNHEKAASTYRALFELFPDNVDYGLQLAGAEHAAGHDDQSAQSLAQLRRLPAPASDDPRIDLLSARVGQGTDPQRLALIRSAEHKATAQGKKLIYATARKEECENFNYSDHPADAPAACEEAYSIFMAMGNRLGAADAIRMLGDFEGSRGHLEQAIATYERALKILQELGEHYKTGAALNNMAINYENQGNLDRAEQLYRQAMFHFEQVGDKRLVGTTVNNVADILFLRGNLPGAAKLYQQVLDISAALNENAGYTLFRLADLNLAQGHVQQAHQLAQQGVEAIRASQGGYGYLSEAMISLGEVLKAEANLSEARHQFQSAFELDQKLGAKGLAEESQAELSALALEEGHAQEAESLIRAAIAQFEQEKSDPAAASAYTVLSRALLMEGKSTEADKAIRHAAELTRTSPDPDINLPVAVQMARLEMAQSGSKSVVPESTRQKLQSTVATAKKLGYYGEECEARLALGELELRRNPAQARAQLGELAAEARRHGLELVAQKAERALNTSAGVLAVNKRAD